MGRDNISSGSTPTTVFRKLFVSRFRPVFDFRRWDTVILFFPPLTAVPRNTAGGQKHGRTVRRFPHARRSRTVIVLAKIIIVDGARVPGRQFGCLYAGPSCADYVSRVRRLPVRIDHRRRRRRRQRACALHTSVSCPPSHRCGVIGFPGRFIDDQITSDVRVQ